ncbi:hypothetical protein SLE2022_111820 [Rubroshorea leprosula]
MAMLRFHSTINPIVIPEQTVSCSSNAMLSAMTLLVFAMAHSLLPALTFGLEWNILLEMQMAGLLTSITLNGSG